MLTDFFSDIAKKEPNLINRLNQYGSFSISKDHWIFTLPNLFKFLQENKLLKSATEYDQFRRALYNSSVNESIKQYDAEILIEENTSKVDESVYKLIWKAN